MFILFFRMKAAEEKADMQHVFLIGAKSFGAYGGYETFIDKLTEYHADNPDIKYHVAVKKNGQGACVPKEAKRTGQSTYRYHNADCFEIKVAEWLGPAQAIYYDCAALAQAIKIIKRNQIEKPIVYIMACRIGPFFRFYAKQIRKTGGELFLNPDGHEWLRSKWPIPVRKYWKYSEKIMVESADLVVCDSLNIERYIHERYGRKNTLYIAYGAETRNSECSSEKFEAWLRENGLRKNEYYLIVGRFVPENNYESMIREYIQSNTEKDLVIVANSDTRFLAELEKKLRFSRNQRIKFVGTVYDRELLKKIREEAWGYLHGHEVGGTNPSLLEALGSTKLNLLFKVGFNEEVAGDAALYWTKEAGNLARLIDWADSLDSEVIVQLGECAKNRICKAYSWNIIADRYHHLWDTGRIG